MLAQSGIEVSRNTLYDDINLLNEYGYEVLSYKRIQNCYYVVDRKFATAELSMFAKAVAASKLTVGQKSVIAEKLSGLVGKYQAEDISSNLIFFDMPKRSNSQIIYNISRCLRSRSLTRCLTASFCALVISSNFISVCLFVHLLCHFVTIENIHVAHTLSRADWHVFCCFRDRIQKFISI